MRQWINGDSVDISAPGQWTVTGDSALNTAQTLTKSAVSGHSHYITAIDVAISGAAAVNDITIELKDGNTTIWKQIIGSGAPRGDRTGATFSFPLKLTAGNAAKLVVTAGGTGVMTTANMAGHTA